MYTRYASPLHARDADPYRYRSRALYDGIEHVAADSVPSLDVVHQGALPQLAAAQVQGIAALAVKVVAVFHRCRAGRNAYVFAIQVPGDHKVGHAVEICVQIVTA
jgi:hypothetical protein